jgi:hypothetical protein
MTGKVKKFLQKAGDTPFYPGLLILLFILGKIRIREVNPDLNDTIVFILANFTLWFMVLNSLNRLVKDHLKSSLIVFLFLLFILWYHQIKISLLKISILNSLLGFLSASDKAREFLLVAFLVLLIILSGVAIVRSGRSFLRMTQYLNLLLVFLILYKLYAGMNQNTTRIKLLNQDIGSVDSIGHQEKTKPDVIYIILDGYTSNRSLADYWNFDNSDFLNFLTKNGFYVATGSRTNYNMTPYSLASALNMSFLSNTPKALPTNAQEKNLFGLVNENRAFKLFEQNDYNIANLSFFDIGQYPREYNDYFFLLREQPIAGTLYEPIVRKLYKKWQSAQNAGLLSLKDVNLGILDKLPRAIGNTGKPSFVYAHVMMPHEPYFFDQEGKTDTSYAAVEPVQKDKYLGQLKYLNGLVENAVSKILAESSGHPPVIIIQGDHGWRYLRGKDQTKESFTILNAYYFPDKDYSMLYPSISPVNSFRVVFDKYFGYKLPILKDTVTNVFVF